MAMASADLTAMSPVERRLKQLERLLLTNGDDDCSSISVETLLDVLLVLYDECCNSALRREKTVSDFIEMSELSTCIYLTLRHVRLGCAKLC